MKKTFDTEILVGPDRTAVIRVTMPDDVPTGLHRATIVFDAVEPQAEALPVLFNPEGLWAGQETDVSDEELAAARSEMWGKFDREEPL